MLYREVANFESHGVYYNSLTVPVELRTLEEDEGGRHGAGASPGDLGLCGRHLPAPTIRSVLTTRLAQHIF